MINIVDCKKDLVSIILPTYNGSRYIAQSIESCLNQTYGNIELIIVNDASTDSTEEIITSYQDTRIIYLKNSENLGLPKSLNVGFSKSSGKYLTWTSDDNHYAPNALEEMLQHMRKNRKIDFLYCSGYKIDSDGKTIGQFATAEGWKLWKYNCVGPCFIYKRDVYNKIGNYDSEMLLVEDYDYWLRVYKIFKMKRINEKLYYIRVHDQSLTSRYDSGEVYTALKRAFEKNITIRYRISYHLRDKTERLCSIFKRQHS